MKKKILSILLVALMIMMMLPTVAFAEAYTTLPTAATETDGTTIKLEENATYTISSAWTVPSGITKLDLNGSTVNINDSTQTDWNTGMIMLSGHTLQITGGTITTTGSTYVLYIENASTVTITNTTINAKDAVIGVFDGSKLTLGSGANVVASHGDGVRAYEADTVVTVKDGAVVTGGNEGNTSYGSSGICVYDGAKLDLVKGTVSSKAPALNANAVTLFEGGEAEIGKEAELVSTSGNGVWVRGGRVVSEGNITAYNAPIYVWGYDGDSAGSVEINGGTLNCTYPTDADKVSIYFDSRSDNNNSIVVNGGELNGTPIIIPAATGGNNSALIFGGTLLDATVDNTQGYLAPGLKLDATSKSVVADRTGSLSCTEGPSSGNITCYIIENAVPGLTYTVATDDPDSGVSLMSFTVPAAATGWSNFNVYLYEGGTVTIWETARILQFDAEGAVTNEILSTLTIE